MNQTNYQNYEYIVNEHIGLVYTIVNRFHVNAFDRDDLIQAGLLGLIKAAEKFDLGLGYKFSTYAVPYILGNIKKELRNIKLEKEKIDIREYVRIQVNNLVDNNTSTFHNKYFYNDEMVLEIAKLGIIEQEIIKLKLIEGLTEANIALKLKISQSTVSRKLKKIKEKIKDER